MRKTRRTLPAAAIGVPVRAYLPSGGERGGMSELPASAYTVEGRVVTIHDPDRYPPDALSFAWNSNATAPTPPVAEFTVSATTGTAPLTVTFTDTSTGAPTSRAWDFGDGTAGGGSVMTHTYTTPGSYTVSLTVTNAAGTDTVTKAAVVTVTDPAAPSPDPQPDGWDPATMLGSDDVHPNDTGMTYLADAMVWALDEAGLTPAAGTPVYAYGDSWTASDVMCSTGNRALLQLINRLSLGTLTNNAVGGDHAGDCAVRAIGNYTYKFPPGTTGFGFIAAGLNDTHMSDTAQQRTATENHLRALFAAMCAAERIEQTAFTYAGSWSNTANANNLYSGGSNAIATANGSTATYTITTPGTYYLVLNGVDGSKVISGGSIRASQNGVDLATQAENAQHVDTGHALTVGVGPLVVRLDNVQAGDLVLTFDKTATGNGFIDALYRMAPTPLTILAVKPVIVTEATRAANRSLLGYVRDLYDTLAAEFGANVVVCDPDPSWTP